MTIMPLKNYLRTYRKRVGLTHDEVAFLMGGMCGTTCQRHESGRRLPTLTTVLKYEVIFGSPTKQLYRGLAEEIRKAIQVRARGLIASVEAKKKSRERERKLIALRTLLIVEALPSQHGRNE